MHVCRSSDFSSPRLDAPGVTQYQEDQQGRAQKEKCIKIWSRREKWERW